MRNVLLVCVGVVIGLLAAALFLVAGQRSFAEPATSLSAVEDRFAKLIVSSPAPGAPAAEAGDEAAMGAREEKVAEKRKVAKGLGLFGAGVGGGGAGHGRGGGLAGIGGLGARGLGAGGGKLDLMLEAEQAPAPDEAPARTRAWFPETFLFEPLVVTNEDGRAAVSVPVPDRLTTWRVLALAHSRDGAQAGTVSSFLGTLDTYVEPVVPPFLRAGDAVRLPVQVVNTTDAARRVSLALEAQGAATLEPVPASLEVPARGSTVLTAALAAKAPGVALLKATIDADAVERTLPVEPVGRPVSASHTGTLAAPRTPRLALPVDANPEYARVRLVVWPGALALVRAELAACTRRGGVADDAYSLLLAGTTPALLSVLGGEPDFEALRRLTIVATQRAVRHARGADVPAAAFLGEAMAAHPTHPVLSRLAERMTTVLVVGQRPDGTFQGATGWSLQRLLVATADAARALSALPKTTPTRAALVRASGAFERHLGHVQDGYTAAALVASGAVEGAVAETLRELVRKAVTKDAEGRHGFTVEADVERADGRHPARAEALALAVLALDPEKDAAPRADFGAELLSSYVPGRGWGDGRTNVAALRAVTALFREPVPSEVRLSVRLDDREVFDGLLDAAATQDLFSREAVVAGVAGEHTWTIAATPPVPGLGFSLAVEAWAPWKAEKGGGLELEVAPVEPAVVGRPVALRLDAAAPSGYPLVVRQELPAGVQPDTASLDALVGAGTIERWDTEDGAVTFHVGALDPGRTLSLAWKAIPTLAGELQSGPARLVAEGRPDDVAWAPPAKWIVRPAPR